MSTQTQPIIPITLPYDSMSRRNSASSQHRDILAAINRESAATVASITRQTESQFNMAHANQVETRQAVERTADQTSNHVLRGIDHLGEQTAREASQLSTQASANSIAGLLATQNTATATQLGVQNTATATQLGVQNTASSIINSVRDASSASAALLSALSVQAERINGLQTVESKNIQVNQGRDLGAVQLLAAQNFAALQLQTSEQRGHLTNHITATSDAGILRTTESMNKILEKLCECCCENKIMQKETQQLISANEASSLRSALAAAQQDALLARLSDRGGGRP